MYAHHRTSRDKLCASLVDEFVQGLRTYFNHALGRMLLYRIERHQYGDILVQIPNEQVVDIYGCEHLLRLLVKMPQLLSMTDLNVQEIGQVKQEIVMLYDFIQLNADTLLVTRYENAPNAYINQLKSQ
jgi:mortality factor 4-like protein 1